MHYVISFQHGLINSHQDVKMNNFYQQNNTAINTTSVTIAQITFNYIKVDSDISYLLNRLRLSFNEFDGLAKHRMPADKIKEKAIEINSIIYTTMDATNDIYDNERVSFATKLIESIAAVCEKYKEVENGSGLNELRNELVNHCREFFSSNIERYINAQDFWWQLRLYEWLKKEGFVSARDRSSNFTSDSIFTNEELETFFHNNRKEIIKSIITQSQNSNLNIENPLNHDKHRIYFDTFKKLPLKTI